MSVKTATSALETPFVQNVRESYTALFGSAMRPQSEAALSDLERLPFPTTKTEFWKYTRLGKLTRNAFRFSTPNNPQPQTTKIPGADTAQLTFVNGILNEQLSDPLPEGITLSVFGSDDEFPDKLNALAQPKKHVLEALNTAFCPQTIVLRVAKNTAITPLVHLAHWSEGSDSVVQPRLIVHVDDGSKARFVQSFDSTKESGFTNSLSEYFVGENAVMNLYKIEAEQSPRFHHSADYARVESGGRFEILTTPLGVSWTRNNLNIKLAGEHAFAQLNGLSYLDGAQHLDNNTFVDHAVPHCDSSELYKLVLSGKSTGVFNGKVIVRPDAQKTNAFQQNSNLLLSSDAQNFAKPELEIYADDVKCSHGSTTGQMDEEAIFYLRSRAIGKDEAQKMLVTAFAGEVLDEITEPSVKQYLYDKFSD